MYSVQFMTDIDGGLIGVYFCDCFKDDIDKLTG